MFKSVKSFTDCTLPFYWFHNGFIANYRIRAVYYPIIKCRIIHTSVGRFIQAMQLEMLKISMNYYLRVVK